MHISIHTGEKKNAEFLSKSYHPESKPQIGWAGPILEILSIKMLITVCVLCTLNIKRKSALDFLVVFWYFSEKVFGYRFQGEN